MNTNTGLQLTAASMTAPRDGACSIHPAFDADHCPRCGTARVIGS